MRFGVCAGVERAALLAEVGYDYIELGVASDLVPDADETEWLERRRAIDTMPLRPEAFNSFVRSGKITGADVDTDYLRRYVRTALRRASEVGGKIIVFGSGGARNVPDGFPRERAEAQIRDFLNLCADASEETGVTVVIEPLNHKESNILNTVAESAGVVAQINRIGVRNLADTYHMEADSEPIRHIVRFADVLAHVHTADTNRLAPGTGTYDHVALFAALREAHYDARISIECQWKDFDSEVAPALEHLKRALRTNTATGSPA